MFCIGNRRRIKPFDESFIAFLHMAAHSINRFFVLPSNLAIYNKLVADFTPNMPKYVFIHTAKHYGIKAPFAGGLPRRIHPTMHPSYDHCS